MSISDTHQESRFFLGKEGEQIGPLTESQVLSGIRSGNLPPQTLVWTDGMTEWAPLAESDPFAPAFSKQSSKIKRKVDFKPVFSESEARFTDNWFVSQRILHITVGVVILAIGTIGYFYFLAKIRPPHSTSITKMQSLPAKTRKEVLNKTETTLIDAERKIIKLFPKVSFHYVDSLASHLEKEFPQIKFLSRPFIEIKKTINGEYRITGSYRGKVVENNKIQSGLFFVFWQNNGEWTLVDTNLTPERRRLAENERIKLQPVTLKSEELLKTLERVTPVSIPDVQNH